MKRKRSSSRPNGSVKRALAEHNVHRDPVVQFNNWFSRVLKSKNPQPLAMALATASAIGKPTVRIVLLKAVDSRGFSFYTNYDSVKGRQLAENPTAALLFYWAQFGRQVRVEGTVERLTRKESLEYFEQRPRTSRIGAWASHQSNIIESRLLLESRFRKYQKKFRNGTVPLPNYWGGYRLVPRRFEFWQSRPNRLHDRIAYVRQRNSWRIVRLSP